MRLTTSLIFITGFLLLQLSVTGQDSIQPVPSKYLSQVSSKADQLEKKLDRKSEKALLRMEKLEARIAKKLGKIDSLKAKQLLENTAFQYKKIENKLLGNTLSLKQYIPSLDTLSTSLKFLNQDPQWLSNIKNGQQKLNDALTKVDGLEKQFQKADEIKRFLRERKQYLKDELGKFGFAKELKRINKQAYYYSEQLNEYKAMLKDHKKAERKALELLSETKPFKDFMKKNSMLASFFPMPVGSGTNPSSQAGFAGLQTRAQLNNFFQQASLNTADPFRMQQQLRQSIDRAGAELNELRNKISQLTGGKSNGLEMPDFKPNSQKTKTFLERLEYGATFQSQNAKGFFPATSDLGLSVGYKPNDKSIIGIGAAYKIGWGNGWNNIKLTNQGLGLRSFVDWKIKGELWISGGYEMNYRTLFSRIEELQHLNAWQQSGLLGLTKTFSIRSKFFKKTKLQLLWDLLSYQQVPRTQAVLFRVGYNF